MITMLSWIAAGAAVMFGVLVFRLGSMTKVAFALLASVLCVAVEIALVGLSYLGIVLVLMTIMEMALMAVFMVTYLLRPAGVPPMSVRHDRKRALAVAAGTFFVLTLGILLVSWSRSGPATERTTEALGSALKGSAMPTLLVLGLALFAAIVATVVLAPVRVRYEWLDDDPRSEPTTDPIAGGVGQ